MTEEERRRLELEAEAEAEAEYEYLNSANAQNVVAPSFGDALAGGEYSALGNMGQWAKDIVTAPYHAAVGLGNLIGDVSAEYATAPYTGDTPGMLPAIGRSLYRGTVDPTSNSQTVANIAKRTGDLAVGSLPFVGPALQTGFDYVTDPYTGGAKSPAAYGEQLREGVAMGVVPAIPGLVKSGSQATHGIFTGIKDALVGKPREVILAERAGGLETEAFANALNVASKRSTAEDALIQRAAGSDDAFARINPVKGVDPYAPAKPGQAKPIEVAEQNLDLAKVGAINARAKILDQASTADLQLQQNAAATGQSIKSGIEFSDLPESITSQEGASFGLEKIKNTVPEGEAGVAAAQRYVQKEFGIEPTYPFGKYEGAPTELSTGRALSLSEANNARMRIDNQIRELGGWDDATLLSQNISPSTRNGTIEALKYYRGQLDQAIKSRISSVLGEPAAKAFTEAGENYSAASTYGDIFGRFKRETGQAFTPGSAKAVPAGTGMLSTRGLTNEVVQSLSPEIAKRRMQSDQLLREGRAIEDLQKLIDFRTGARDLPAPRGWAQIKSSPEHLFKVGQAAVALGLIASSEQLLSLPDEVGKQVVGQVAAQIPSLFTPTPDGINAIDDKFVTPMDKDVVVERALDMEAADRAEIIGNAFKNKYVPTTTPTPPTAPLPALPMTIEKFTQALELPAPAPILDSSFDGEQDAVVRELQEAISLHAGDYVQ